MHSLLPDDFSFRVAADDRVLKECGLPDVAFDRTHALYQTVSYADVLYSLGTSHPGALVLHNFPRSLQTLRMGSSSDRAFDVATIDILRDRERGVPRYNAFRRMLDMKPLDSFEEMTDNPQWATEMRDVYEDNIEAVDLQIGMLTEKVPPGFAFSDTAFRIFILMASRRLKSDRFFTTDYTPAVYTSVGLDWINGNGMRSVLLRHVPALKPHLEGVRNVFFPWNRSKS